jgi:hypothetical protein
MAVRKMNPAAKVSALMPQRHVALSELRPRPPLAKADAVA